MKACEDGSHYNINRCRSKKCKFQLDFHHSDKIVSTSSNGCSIPFCHLEHLALVVIWLMQYINETALKLNQQFNRHETALCHPIKHIHCRILSERFTLGKCGGAKYISQIIKKLKGNGLTSRNVPESKVTQTCKAKKTH